MNEKEYRVKIDDKYSLIFDFDSTYSEDIFKYKSTKLIGDIDVEKYYSEYHKKYMCRIEFDIEIKEYDIHVVLGLSVTLDYEFDIEEEYINPCNFVSFDIIDVEIYEDKNTIQTKDVTIDYCLLGDELNFVTWIRKLRDLELNDLLELACKVEINE